MYEFGKGPDNSLESSLIRVREKKIKKISTLRYHPIKKSHILELEIDLFEKHKGRIVRVNRLESWKLQKSPTCSRVQLSLIVSRARIDFLSIIRQP